MSIDWSKAPEGAVAHVVRKALGWNAVWVCCTRCTFAWRLKQQRGMARGLNYYVREFNAPTFGIEEHKFTPRPSLEEERLRAEVEKLRAEIRASAATQELPQSYLSAP